MNPNEMSVVLRERHGFEGADMGIRLLQANLRAAYGPWLAVMVPFMTLCLLTGLIHPTLAGVLIWWLAPAGERLVLMVLSRAAFNTDLTWREAVRETWQRGRNGVWLQLTLLRFSPNRGMMTPVLMLEEPDFATYRQRAKALLRSHGGAMGLTVAFLHAEWFMELSLVVFAAMLMPQHAVQWQYWFEAAMGSTGAHVTNVAYALVVLAVRPFYVAAGFGAYLARRTNLEGWDVELAFRGLAKRLATGLSVVVLALCLLPISESRAAEATTAEGQAAKPAEIIAEIVENPPFRNDVEQKTYFDFSWLFGFDGIQAGGSWMGVVAMLLRVAAVVALALMLFVAVRACMKVVVPRAGSKDSVAADEVGISFLGESEQAEPLPDQPGVAARRLAESGQLRQALSLLIRASIAAVRARFAVKIPKGATERDCLAQVRRGAPAREHGYFRDLLATWQVVAYAGREVSVAQVVRLADDFDQVYGRQSPPERSS